MRLAGGDALVDVGVDPRTGERHNDVINVVNGIQIVSPADHQPSRIRVNVVDALLPGPYVIFNKTPEMDGALEAAGNAGSPISWSMRDGGRTIAPEARFLDAARGFQLGATESNMLDALQKAWNASTLSDAALFGAFAGVDSPEAYRKAVATLSPQGYLAAAAAQLERASSAMDAAMSCRDDDLSRGQDPAGCIWGRISSGRAWRDGVQPEQGTRRSDITYRFGVRTPLAPQWWVGVSGAYVTANTATPYGYLQSRGQGADMSVALGHDVGNWTFAAAASFGYGSHDATQHVAIGANNWNARSNQQTWTTGMRLHASYLMDLGVFRVRPFTNLDAIHVSSPGFTTTGDLPAAYRFDALRQWTAQVNPGVEIGAQFQIADNVWLRPDVTVGADFAFGDRTLQTGVELGAGGARFTTVQALDPITLDASAGLSLLVNQNVELRTEYRTRVGESTRSNEAVGRLSVRF